MDRIVSSLKLEREPVPEDLVYKSGLDRIREAVISSHFMDELVKDANLELYDEGQFSARSLEIDSELVDKNLIPIILSASNVFWRSRAALVLDRAKANYRKYGLRDPGEIGIAQSITEVMFDRQYLRGSKESCSRQLLCNRVKERIDTGSPIEMVIPALPYKISSPLKNRGRLPDLAEVSFILRLYEIAATIELIYREARPDLPGRLAGFTVISDGSRFNHLVDEPDNIIENYRAHLGLWVERLGLQRYVSLLDYRSLLRDRLPAVTLEAKSEIRNNARAQYADAMDPIFNPYEMAATIRAVAEIEPDPEYSNGEGRFVSLLKSLIFTINYKALKRFEGLPARQYRALYRDLTGHIFEPYAILSPAELQSIQEEMNHSAEFPPEQKLKECLRQLMLREAWNAAIDYVAEIKSDRDLDQDPILTCLPDHFRWTIHAKAGQLAILMPTALGISVQAWAGSAVFKLTKHNKIKLCTLPVLALEGAGAIPVRVRGMEDSLALTNQPLFYIYPDVEFTDLDEFLSKIRTLFVRYRTS